MEHHKLQNESVFPISVVKDLTGLTARQIRYYEQHGLIQPDRTEGNRRIYCLNDIIRCLEIKKLIEKGVNISGIKAVYESNGTTNQLKGALSEQELRALLIKLGIR